MYISILCEDDLNSHFSPEAGESGWDHLGSNHGFAEFVKIGQSH